ncbi:MAG: hypothetical protein R6U57_09485 [Anaerolineales bacterium]
MLVLTITCFLIAHKDWADMHRYQFMGEDLRKTTKITAKLVAGNMEQSMKNVPGDTRAGPQEQLLDWNDYEEKLQTIWNWEGKPSDEPHVIRHAQWGMEFFETLEREGYSFKQK